MTPTERETVLEAVLCMALEDLPALLPEVRALSTVERIDLANGVRRDVARRLAQDLTAHVS